MKFKCEIDMGNAAFEESTLELALILEKIADRYHINQQTSGNVYDSNGNCVGQWRIK